MRKKPNKGHCKGCSKNHLNKGGSTCPLFQDAWMAYKWRKPAGAPNVRESYRKAFLPWCYIDVNYSTMSEQAVKCLPWARDRRVGR